MKKSILTLIALAMALGVFAASVSPEEAMVAANAWAARNGAFGAGQGATNVVTECDAAHADVVLWHQVSLAGGGMLVVAPVTEIEPVVMALDNDPGVLPEAHPLRGILTGDMRRRLQFLGLYPRARAALAAAAPSAPVADEAQAWGEACKAKWRRLTGASLRAAGVGAETVAVEVRVVPGFEKKGALTHWNQGKYGAYPLYNLYTPNHAVCGCVATACAALAQFYGTTNAVSGLVNDACTYNGKPYTAKTMGGPIDWSILPENWGGTNAPSTELTTEQQQLIGRVAFDAGVGVGMMWSDGESGAVTANVADALKNVFGFRHARHVAMSDAENPAQEELEKLVYNQCRAGVPVGMSIEGHAVVAAGYGLDADGVERVRVFMGWSGSGDGWYALPKIDTQATVGGGTYLSEIVKGVITMIAYDDDDIVPIVGKVSMPGAALEIPALDRVLASNGAGYFGTRVPANMGTCTVTCQGRTAALDIGEAAAEAQEAGELCPALPEAFSLPLLNCTVAYSLERAKLYAEKEGKAILRVSGTGGDPATTNLLNMIYALDAGNVNGFSDTFVYLFSDRASLEGDGADLSFGVYLPSELDPAEHWLAQNGALAYGYTSKSEGGEVSTWTFAPLAAAPAVVTNDATNFFGAVSNSLLRVLGVGAARFAECTSGITVTIGATSKAAEAAINATADPAQACGVHANCYTNGPYTFTCDAVVTNQDAGVVLACGGWTATNATTGAVLSGAGRAATLALAANDAVTLTWDFSTTNAVYVTVVPTCPNAPLGGCTVTPGTGWYAWGEAAGFTATCAAGYEVASWVLDKQQEDLIDLGRRTKLLPVSRPCRLDVSFTKSGAAEAETTNTVRCTARSWCITHDGGSLKLVAARADEAPKTEVWGVAGRVTLASGEAANVAAAAGREIYIGTEARAFMDAGKTNWTLWGVVRRSLTGAEDAAKLMDEAANASAVTVKDPTAPVALSWLWVPNLPEDEPVPVPGAAFAIEWDDALSTLNAHGYATNLTTLAWLAAQGLSLEDVTVTAPKGFTANVRADADGNVVATLELDAGVLKPLAAGGVGSPLTILSNGDGTLTVKAAVGNGVRGFWYALHAADELRGAWAPVKTGYAAGTPSVQAQADGAVTVSIDVAPTAAKRFYRLVVSDVRP